MAVDAGIDHDYGWYWRPGWLPLLEPLHGAVTVADCAWPPMLPLHVVDYEDAEGNFHEPAAASLTAAIGASLEFIDTGLLRFDMGTAGWTTRVPWADLTPHQRAVLLQ